MICPYCSKDVDILETNREAGSVKWGGNDSVAVKEAQVMVRLVIHACDWDPGRPPPGMRPEETPG